MCSSFLSFRSSALLFFFFFNDTATTEIYTLSLHDALPIFAMAILLHLWPVLVFLVEPSVPAFEADFFPSDPQDRKSTRLNSSHTVISYAVFCLKKKNT